MDRSSGSLAVIGSLDELSAHLMQVQSLRETEVRCQLMRTLSDRLSDAALVEALVIGLPMVQGIQHRIVRSRDRGAVLTAKLRYRQGVRMLDLFRCGKGKLTNEECLALADARDAVMPILSQGDEQVRFDFLYDLVCRRVTYVHTAPGRKGYERLVGAASVLKDGKANCQGFADLLYLLCGICGIEAEYRCQQGERHLHVWNRVRLKGEWRDADASRGARNRAEEQRIDIFSTKLGSN